MAGSIANAEKDGLVFGFGFCERGFAPRVPIDWIMGVLLEIGAGFGGESIHKLTIPLKNKPLEEGLREVVKDEGKKILSG